ncbi:barstar family protein [Lysinibacillus fusiformis]|nr:barstar family protein [Lysinibacillus fusiformis]
MILFIELEGANIQSWEDYISEIEHKFKFPSSCTDSIDRYLDWMRDLDWLEKEKYILVINNYKYFLKDSKELKNDIIRDFKETILPFWQTEVKDVIVDGKPKTFMVYLVE